MGEVTFTINRQIDVSVNELHSLKKLGPQPVQQVRDRNDLSGVLRNRVGLRI